MAKGMKVKFDMFCLSFLVKKTYKTFYFDFFRFSDNFKISKNF